MPFTLSILQSYTCIKNFDLLGEVCQPSKQIPFPYDLAKHYVDVLEESEDSGFIPDLRLIHRTSPEKNLWVEIKVSHGSEQAKLDSGKKIVEIHLKREDDIEMIGRAALVEGEGVACFNFERPNIELQTFEKCFCDQSGRLPVSVVHRTGKFYMRSFLSLEDARKEICSPKYLFAKPLNAGFYGSEVVFNESWSGAPV